MATESRNPKYVAVLALVASVILVLGYLIKPKRQLTQAGAGSVLSQAELARLNHLAQKGSLEDTIAYFSQIAHEVAPHLVWVETTAKSGVIWDSDGLIVTPNTEDRFPESVLLKVGRSGSRDGQRTVAPPHLPIAALRTSEDRGLPPVERMPVVLPFVGEWIVAVWRMPDQDRSFAPGLYLGTTVATCGEIAFNEMLANIPLSAAMAGGGLFDQDGRLLAIVVSCGDRHVAMAVENVMACLDEANSFEGRMLTRYGMKAEPLTESEKKYFKTPRGMLITEVWRGYPADVAGLLPGDLISKLNGKPVNSLDDLQILVLPVAREIFELRVRRAGQERVVGLHARVPKPSLSSKNAGKVGLVLESQSGYRVEAVLPGTRADRAGVRPGDHLLRIDQLAPQSAVQVQRVLAREGGTPAFVLLQRGDRRWGVLLNHE